jgi:DNA-binding transcriptional LysR family regulator
VQILEAEIGATLFRRGRNGLDLTEAGRLVARDGHRLLSDVSLLKQEARRLHGGRGPSLVVGVLQSLLVGVFPRMMLRWRRDWSEVPVRVLGFRSAQIRADVIEGRQLLGFISASSPDPRLTCRALAREEFVAVLPLSHPLAARDADAPLTLADVGRGGLIIPPPSFGLRDSVDEAFAAAGATPRLIAEIEAIDAIVALVRGGLGASILPRWSVMPGAGVVSRRLAAPAPARTLCAIWRASTAPDPAMRSLVEAAAEVLTAETAVPGG